MALLGGPWVAKGDIACALGSSQGTKGFLENEWYFWMTGWIYRALLLSQKGEAEKWGEGSALIKL